jgi:hypothetical protein
MSNELHARAEHLIARERVEEIPATEREWLAKHLDDCEACAAVAASTEQALASLRGVSVELPRGLASRTQLRVRVRADELREHAPKRSLLWAITAMSWALGVATAPWVWRGFSWIGEHTGRGRSRDPRKERRAAKYLIAQIIWSRVCRFVERERQ